MSERFTREIVLVRHGYPDEQTKCLDPAGVELMHQIGKKLEHGFFTYAGVRVITTPELRAVESGLILTSYLPCCHQLFTVPSRVEGAEYEGFKEPALAEPIGVDHLYDLLLSQWPLKDWYHMWPGTVYVGHNDEIPELGRYILEYERISYRVPLSVPYGFALGINLEEKTCCDLSVNG